MTPDFVKPEPAKIAKKDIAKKKIINHILNVNFIF
jgi:hypothetical protein